MGKQKRKNYKAKETGTDAILKNLTTDKKQNQNGSFINYDNESGGFSNVNTSAYGIEQDVDDL